MAEGDCSKLAPITFSKEVGKSKQGMPIFPPIAEGTSNSLKIKPVSEVVVDLPLVPVMAIKLFWELSR